MNTGPGSWSGLRPLLVTGWCTGSRLGVPVLMERFAPGRVVGAKEALHGKRHDEKDEDDKAKEAKKAEKTKKAERPYQDLRS